MDITDEQFATIIAKVMDELPEKYIQALDNVQWFTKTTRRPNNDKS